MKNGKLLGFKGEETFLTPTDYERMLWRELQKSEGKDIWIWRDLAGFYEDNGYLDRSDACMQRLIESTDELEEKATGHLVLGSHAEKRGNFANAAAHYRNALALEPCSTSTWYFIHNNLGFSLNQLEDYATAVPLLKSALEIEPGRPNAYKNLALSYVGLGELEKAAVLFVHGTLIYPKDPRSLGHLEELVRKNPSLLVDISGLEDRLEECRLSVKKAHAEN